MPTYKLIYFNVKGRAEQARYMFALSGTDYEDFRFEKDQWPDLKQKTPLGQVPVLEVDGVPIAQSAAINRFLAKELGFMGTNNLEAAKIDVVIETIIDMTTDIGKVFREQDPEKKVLLQKDLREKIVVENAALLEKLLKLNNNGNGFFVGDKISLADVQCFGLYHDFLPIIGGGPLNIDDVPKLKSLLERLQAIPEISSWIKKRPSTSM